MKEYMAVCIFLISLLTGNLYGQEKKVDAPKRFTLEPIEWTEKETFEGHPSDGIVVIYNDLEAQLSFESNEIPNFNYIYDKENSRYILFFPSGPEKAGIQQILTVKARGYTYKEFTEVLKIPANTTVYYRVYDLELERAKIQSQNQDIPWLWIGVAIGAAVVVGGTILIVTQLSPGSSGEGSFPQPPISPPTGSSFP